MCIWEGRVAAPISACVRSLGEAQPQDLPIAVAEHTQQALDGDGLVGQVVPGVLDADEVGQVVARLGVIARAVERDCSVGAGGPGASGTCSVRTLICLAISSGVGTRPSSDSRSSATRSTRTESSCRSRGTRTNHPLSL